MTEADMATRVQQAERYLATLHPAYRKAIMRRHQLGWYADMGTSLEELATAERVKVATIRVLVSDHGGNWPPWADTGNAECPYCTLEARPVRRYR